MRVREGGLFGDRLRRLDGSLCLGRGSVFRRCVGLDLHLGLQLGQQRGDLFVRTVGDAVDDEMRCIAGDGERHDAGIG